MKKSIHLSASKKVTEVTAVLIGIAAASAVGFLLVAGLTSLIMKGTLGEANTELYVFAVRMTATALGCLISTILVKGKCLIITGAVALGYLAVLIGIGIAVYDGSFNNMFSAIVSVLLGGGIICAVVLKPLKKSKHKVRYGR